MKTKRVEEGGVHCLDGVHLGEPLETITVVAHNDSGNEEELLTITAQATPEFTCTQDRVVVEALPETPPATCTGVCDGGCAGMQDDTDACKAGVTLCSSRARPSPHTTFIATTIKAGKPKRAASPQHPRCVVVKDSISRPTYPVIKTKVVPPPNAVNEPGFVGHDSETSGHSAPPVPCTSDCRRTAVSHPPHVEQQHGGANAHSHRRPEAEVVVGDVSSSMTYSIASPHCILCKSLLGSEDGVISFHLHNVLPNSLLDATSLLQYLDVTSPLDTLATGTKQSALCEDCCSLLYEGDKTYHRMMHLINKMKERWSGVPPAPVVTAGLPWVSKKLQATPPKRGVLSGATVQCGFCAAPLGKVEEWRVHAYIKHRFSTRWRNPMLQEALKACLVEELHRGSGRQGTRCCPACNNTFSELSKFVKHLRQHHILRVDEDCFLMCLDGSNGMSPVTLGHRQQRNTSNFSIKSVKVEQPDDYDEEQEEYQQAMERTETGYTEGEECDELSPRKKIKLVGDRVKHESVELEFLKRPRECRNQWKCRFCGDVFTSQRHLNQHKRAAHPDVVRAGRGRRRSSGPYEGGTASNGCEELKSPGPACQEGIVVIMEGDGSGNVTHRRLDLESTTTTTTTATATTTTTATATASITKSETDIMNLSDQQQQQQQQEVVGGECEGGGGGGGKGMLLLECNLCSRRLIGLAALRQHLGRVHNRSPQPPVHRHCCRLCQHRSRTRHQLDQHMHERHGAAPPPAPVQCDQCGKTYTARYIDSHIANMHGDTGRFPCDFCPMRFATRGSVQAHVSVEHANTSWACQECPQQFAKYHQLRQHRLYMHSNTEHYCEECPRSFKRRCDLTEHIKRRHQERVLQKCSYCYQVYTDRKRLRMHLMRKHGVPWEDTLAQGYARRQRLSNCLKRREQQQQQQPRGGPRQAVEQQESLSLAEGEQEQEEKTVLEEEQQEYNVVQLTEEPHNLADAISYIILEEAT